MVLLMSVPLRSPSRRSLTSQAVSLCSGALHPGPLSQAFALFTASMLDFLLTYSLKW